MLVKKKKKNHIEEKLRKKILKIIIRLILTFISFNAYSIEIIRDPIAEDYFNNLNDENDFNSFIILDDKPNAFVIENNIYFTTELIKLIEDEDTLKSIFFHELGHIVHNHYESKKIKVLDAQKTNSISNLLSIGVAVISGDPRIGIASNLAINTELLNDLSYNSVNFEIQADEFMISKIKEENINTEGLTNFFKYLPDSKNSYFETHPKNEDRINLLKSLSSNKQVNNSFRFNWIKAKYGKNSEIEDLNEFFKKLERGIVYQIDEQIVTKAFVDYEIYKNGIIRSRNEEMFKNINLLIDNSFLKIEYFNFIIDNQLSNFYNLIEDNKENKELQKEYYFHYIYGKFYAKLNNINLSNFYFCQFFKSTNQSQKIDYYCNNYDKNEISNLDNLNAIFN